VNIQTETYPVIGMSCSACAINIEQNLAKEKGVENVNVNYANNSVLIAFNPEVTTAKNIKNTVKKLGYDIIIETQQDSNLIENLALEHLIQIRNRMLGAVILSVPVFIIGMFFMDMPYANYIMMVFSFPVVFYFGRNFFINAYRQALHKTANMDTLVALSTGIAFIFSLFNTFFAEYWHNKGLHAHVYYESAAVVVAFISLGKWLEEKAKSNTTTAIKKLIGLKPKSVMVLENLMEKEVSINDVKIGNQIVIKPGDSIPVDGKIMYGESYVDESMITGESVPLLKKGGDRVTSGTINQQGSFVFEATAVGDATFLSKIIKMVQEAQGSKAPVQKLVDKIAGIFVPVVIGIAILTFVIWNFSGAENALTHGLLTSITVLVIACPCALGLATPTAIMVGIGKGADNHILIKNAESLELLAKVNTFILDKTGTITKGKPTVIDQWIDEKFNSDAKNILFSIEAKSGHPLANAIVAYLGNNFTNQEITIENVAGKGIKAIFNSTPYYVGSFNYINELSFTIESTLSQKIEAWQKEGYTLVFFANDNHLLAAFAISDPLKETSVLAINKLQKNGIEVYILSGDSKSATQKIAEKVNISTYKGEMLPNDKAEFVKKLQENGKVVAMVGDGINDSQAMAQADVSIAMGKGSDIAIDVAQLTLTTSDLAVIPKAIALSDNTIKTVKQNLFWALIYNIIGIPLAAGALYPINGFLLDPMIAGGAMALSSVSVVLNSLRLKYISI
jgi:P-type Cu2+ transporter